MQRSKIDCIYVLTPIEYILPQIYPYVAECNCILLLIVTYCTNKPTSFCGIFVNFSSMQYLRVDRYFHKKKLCIRTLSVFGNHGIKCVENLRRKYQKSENFPLCP